MLQSTLIHSQPHPLNLWPDPVRTAPGGGGGAPLHVGIIMDGNGRWARQRGLPRTAGHRAGVPAVRSTVEAAPGLGIGVLTLFAFSQDNWSRPPLEVKQLMRLFRAYLRSEADRCAEEGVRVSVIGRRDRLSPALRAGIEAAEATTREGRGLLLQLAIDYSARDAILRAATVASAAGDGSADGAVPTREEFRHLLACALHASGPIPDLDLVIRTGGEARLSDFLLWESAYAELFFSPCLWPDFDGERLAEVMAQFALRERRFGGVPAERVRSAGEG